MDELLGKQHSPRLRYGNRRRPQMLQEQASQLALTQAQAIRQLFNSALVAVQSAFSDKSQRARNCIRSPTPRSEIWRRFWPATQARTISGILRGRGGAEEGAILELGRARRTDRPAVDTR